MSEVRRKPLLSVQYLRALAVLMVVFHHARTDIPWLYNPLVHFNGGARGVDIFFVISGFIMYVAARDEPPATFAWRRFVRVVPLYWAATTVLLLYHLASSDWAPATLATHYVKSMLFVPQWSLGIQGKIFPLLIPGWSLEYEMFFYLLFGVAIYARRLVPIVSAAIIVLVTAGAIFDFRSPVLISFTNPRLLALLAGVWIGVCYRRFTFRNMALALPVGLALLLLFADAPPAWRTLPAAAIVVGALSLERSLPRLPRLKLLGDASYSIYLSHPFTLIFVDIAVKALPIQGVAQFATFMGLALILCPSAGVICHLLVERPLLNRLGAHIGGARPAGSPPVPDGERRAPARVRIR